MILKKCTKCGLVLEATAVFFYRTKRTGDGLANCCKGCSKEYQRSYYQRNLSVCRKLRRDYQYEQRRFIQAIQTNKKHANNRGYAPCNATPQEIEKAFTGKCHLCGVPEVELTKRLACDHDHTTGKFRGWLWWKCNSLLGSANDSQDILCLASNYLHRTQPAEHDFVI